MDKRLVRKKYTMKTKGIIFDLDNTLVDRDKSLTIFSAIFHSHYKGRLLPVPSVKVEGIIKDADQDGYRPKTESFSEMIQELAWKKEPTVFELAKFWNKEFPGCAQPVSDLYKVLDEIDRRGIAMGVVTNGPTHSQTGKMRKLRIRKYLKSVVISEAAGVKKPDPKIFYLALQKLQLKPNETLAVGDNPVSDVVGARNAGLKPVWVTGHFSWPKEYEPPDYQISDLKEILTIID